MSRTVEFIFHVQADVLHRSPVRTEKLPQVPYLPISDLPIVQADDRIVSGIRKELPEAESSWRGGPMERYPWDGPRDDDEVNWETMYVLQP